MVVQGGLTASRQKNGSITGILAVIRNHLRQLGQVNGCWTKGTTKTARFIMTLGDFIHDLFHADRGNHRQIEALTLTTTFEVSEPNVMRAKESIVDLQRKSFNMNNDLRT